MYLYIDFVKYAYMLILSRGEKKGSNLTPFLVNFLPYFLVTFP